MKQGIDELSSLKNPFLEQVLEAETKYREAVEEREKELLKESVENGSLELLKSIENALEILNTPNCYIFCNMKTRHQILSACKDIEHMGVCIAVSNYIEDGTAYVVNDPETIKNMNHYVLFDDVQE